jgi:hypothetical protein
MEGTHYDMPNMKLASNGFIVTQECKVPKQSSGNDPYGDYHWKTEQYVFGLKEVSKAMAKFVELGKLAGAAIEDSSEGTETEEDAED